MAKGGCMRFDWIHFHSHNAENNKVHFQVRAVELQFFPFQKIDSKRQIYRNRWNEFGEVSQLGFHNPRFGHQIRYLVFGIKVKMRYPSSLYTRVCYSLIYTKISVTEGNMVHLCRHCRMQYALCTLHTQRPIKHAHGKKGCSFLFVDHILIKNLFLSLHMWYTCTEK